MAVRCSEKRPAYYIYQQCTGASMMHTTRPLRATIVAIAPHYVYCVDTTPCDMKGLGYTAREAIVDITTFGSRQKLSTIFYELTIPRLQNLSKSKSSSSNTLPHCFLRSNSHWVYCLGKFRLVKSDYAFDIRIEEIRLGYTTRGPFLSVAYRETNHGHRH